MIVDTSNFTTRAENADVIAALAQESSEVDSEREFRVDEDYCIGGATEPYYLKEPAMMKILRKEVRGFTAEDMALAWDQLSKRYGSDGSFDVTREGCRQSTIYVHEVDKEGRMA